VDPGNGLTRRRLLERVGWILTAVAGAPARGMRAAPPAQAGPGKGASGVMATLSAYMSDAARRDLPADALEKTKHHLLDTLAAMVSGVELPPGQVALKFARAHDAEKTATIVGTNILCSAIDAALVNGMLAHSDETDDSHAPSHSHPGCAVVPAALAAGEEFGIDGARFLRAVTLGYDIGTRVVLAMGGAEFSYDSSFATHSIAGTFGAAAAAACAAGLDARQMRWALDYTAQQSSGIRAWRRDTDHIEKAFVFGGMPARSGVTSALLVRSGWNGIDDIFSGADNFFLAYAPKAQPERLVEKLGERYEIVETDIKKPDYPSVSAPLLTAAIDR
jgi:2-methylcitrate dehydratase PrpD